MARDNTITSVPDTQDTTGVAPSMEGHYNVRLSPEVHDRLRAESFRTRKPMKDIANEAITEWLDTDRPEKQEAA